MKKALAALAAALVVLAAALYFFVARPLLRPSEVTAVAERALVADDLLVLAAVNVKQAVFIEKWLLGVPPATPVAAPPPTAADRSLLDHLRAGGVDPRHDVDAALFALYPADGATARHAMILVGRFNPAALNGYLTRELGAAPRPGATPASFTVARLDAATCQPGATWAVTAAREWIAFSDPGSHAALVARLAAARAGGGADERLAWWRGLSRGDVAGVGLPGLERLESGATQSFARGEPKFSFPQGN